MMKAKGTHQNKFMRILAIPIRALAKARDLYVKSMNNYADKVHYGVGPGFGSVGYSVPRSFSTNSARSTSNGDDDFKELVRAASTSTLGTRLELNPNFLGANLGPEPRKEVLNNYQGNSSSSSVINNNFNNNYNSKVIRGVPRSASVGMAKIEEDKPCDFEVNDEISANDVIKKDNTKVNKEKFRLFPRSRSYAVGSTQKPIPSPF